MALREAEHREYGTMLSRAAKEQRDATSRSQQQHRAQMQMQARGFAARGSVMRYSAVRGAVARYSVVRGAVARHFVMCYSMVRYSMVRYSVVHYFVAGSPVVRCAEGTARAPIAAHSTCVSPGGACALRGFRTCPPSRGRTAGVGRLRGGSSAPMGPQAARADPRELRGPLLPQGETAAPTVTWLLAALLTVALCLRCDIKRTTV